MNLFTEEERKTIEGWIRGIENGTWGEPSFLTKHELKGVLERVLEADALVESAGAVVEAHKTAEALKSEINSFGVAKSEVLSIGPSKWEYIVVPFKVYVKTTNLAPYGLDGWELVALDANWARALLKREVVSES